MTAALAELVERHHRARRALDREIGEARATMTAGQAVQAEITELHQQVELHERAAALLSTIGEQRQSTAQAQIETLVTQGLHTIFGPELSFHLVPGVRAKTPVVDFVVRSTLDDTVVDTDVMDARGGGLAAIVGFLLRLVVLLLSADRQDTVMFLDETFAHVSAEYEPRLAEFIREIVNKTGVQIIMVTHSDAYTALADTRYRFTLHNGVTHTTAL